MRWGITMSMIVASFVIEAMILLSGFTRSALPVREETRVDTFYLPRITKLRTEIYTQDEIAKRVPGRPDRSFAADVSAPISEETASRVAELIRAGKTSDPLVQENTIRIVGRNVLKAMLDSIRDNRNGGESRDNNREYGAIVDKRAVIRPIYIGIASNPCVDALATTPSLGKGGTDEFHSHPSGTKPNGKGGTCYYMQGPSWYDQDAVGHRIGYVFAMKDSTIYIYDSTGVKASLPFSFLKDK